MLDRMFLTSPSDEKLFVEDCFATHLYTGNGSTQTITNGIDLSGKGGMVWVKSRSSATSNFLFDTARGGSMALVSNSTSNQIGYIGSLTAFNSNGFTLGSGTGAAVNLSGDTYVSWTFRKAPKFFDVVTYTGNGVSGRQVAHNLGVAPGCIIIKCYGRSGDYWLVYHRGLTSASYSIRLDSTATQQSNPSAWASTAPTDTVFTVGDNSDVNSSGATYVAYLFAHDATADGIIQCGSYTGNGGSQFINLGWEPQFLLTKSATSLAEGQQPYAHWKLHDIMRGIPTGSPEATLYPNLAGAEEKFTQNWFDVNPTGFTAIADTDGYENKSGVTYIYIAIRRGPMRTPTSGTSVFAPVVVNSPPFPGPFTVTTGFPVDTSIVADRASTNFADKYVRDRLRGVGIGSTLALSTLSAAGEFSYGASYGETWDNTGIADKGNGGGTSNIYWNFRRAPGFFDEVCYTGTGAARTVNHNLGVAPELWIVKSRSAASTSWHVGSSLFGTPDSFRLLLNTTGSNLGVAGTWQAPTATTIGIGSTYASNAQFNASGSTYVAYLFASCPGVSKVGSYTGNGSSQTINCGFAAGARFVLIKRTDSTGDWYVWDTARGIVAANDPHLSLNTTAAEVTTNDSIDPESTGFIINQNASTNINVSGATYLYLAIA